MKIHHRIFVYVASRLAIIYWFVNQFTGFLYAGGSFIRLSEIKPFVAAIRCFRFFYTCTTSLVFDGIIGAIRKSGPRSGVERFGVNTRPFGNVKCTFLTILEIKKVIGRGTR